MAKRITDEWYMKHLKASAIDIEIPENMNPSITLEVDGEPILIEVPEYHFDDYKIINPKVWACLVKGLSTTNEGLILIITKDFAAIDTEKNITKRNGVRPLWGKFITEMEPKKQKDPVTELMKLRREERLAVERFEKAKREMWHIRELIALEEQKEEQREKEGKDGSRSKKPERNH